MHAQYLPRRASGLAVTAAVHLAIAGLLLAGWQVSRPRPVPRPIIVTPLPDPVVTPPVAAPTTRDLPIIAAPALPDWQIDTPEPVVAPPAGPASGTASGGDTILAPSGEPRVETPPVPDGPTRSARFLPGGATQPPYPTASRRLGEEGSVVLAVSIAADGSVTGVSLLRSSGFARLDAAALAHARRAWRFEPALAAGKPVAAQREITVRFGLNG